MRIRLLDALRDGPLTINELAETHGTSQQNVSKHVGVLAQAGIVAREKDGNRVRCSIADESIFELCELVCGGCASRSPSSTSCCQAVRHERCPPHPARLAT